MQLSPGFQALRAASPELGLVEALELHLREGDHVGPFERFERDGWTEHLKQWNKCLGHTASSCL